MALTINDIRKALDTRLVPYQDPFHDEYQLILRGTADIIEGGYGDGKWEFYFRSTKDKPTRTFHFEKIEELNVLLDTHYIQQPYDEYSAKPLA